MSNQQHDPIAKLLATSALAAVLYHTWRFVQPSQQDAEWAQAIWGFGALLAVTGAYEAARDAVSVSSKAARKFRALRPKLSASSSSWLTVREARRAGLTEDTGIFLGLLEGRPLSIFNAVHGLICAPARKGKSTSFVMPQLCHDIGASRIVADMKGELLYQTADLIRDQHGHEVIALNPAHKFALGSIPYNPLIVILDDLENAPEDVIADAWSMALQLYPKAPGGERDPYWPNGTRKLFVFVIVALSTLRGEAEAHLPRAYEVLCDNDLIQTLLIQALGSDVLGGELAALAANISANWDTNDKHFESFREGAVQGLVPFGPSGRLAPSMENCGFRFRDLKERKITLFLVCDYSRMDVFAPWLGLLIWAALKELVREDNDIPVHFILDEFTNYRLAGLPNALTALGGYGIRCWIVVQELQEITRVYGAEALATILSQTDVKLFYGFASHKTAQLVSRLLGEYEFMGESFGVGQEIFSDLNLSLAPRNKPLLSPTQLRELPEDEQIIFAQNLPPIRALKAGYQEVDPWRSQVRPTPLYGGEPFLGQVKMRIRSGRMKATRAGRRMIKRPKRPLLVPFFAAASHFKPSGRAVLFIALIVIVQMFGWPYVLTHRTGSGSWCRYAGLPLITQPVEQRSVGECPFVIWKK
ncbi:type IV secretory system conjugative DNA transfer family protein [Stappia stellulata]|uniref:type IV secretory system conjugative DNA transfer family protein n=1 Tax=Stappia stellulata TaxID=71235 RepID=UPI00041207EC|nr:type IV secretory system conjugative DNA transfer family protein [Stappia stellulata]